MITWTRMFLPRARNQDLRPWWLGPGKGLAGEKRHEQYDEVYGQLVSVLEKTYDIMTRQDGGG